MMKMKFQKLKTNLKKWVISNMKSNILLIVVDSLRADKFYSKHKTATTTNINSLIKKGFIFTNAISSTDSTYSSLGSLFSGKNPFNHQINWFQNHSRMLDYFDDLKKNNFHLFGTFQNQTFFQTLRPVFDDVDLVDGEPYFRLFEGLGDKILSRLEQIKNKEPWFYYVHLMDFHISKKLPDEYDKEEFGKTTWDKRLHILDSWIGKILEKLDLSKTIIILTSDHGEFDINLDIDYGSIPKLQKFLKFINPIFPKIIESTGLKMFVFLRETKRKYAEKKLKAKSINEDELRKLSTRGKALLFDDVLRIPLLISGSNIPHGISNQQVRQIDIFPTISDLLKLNIDKHFDGVSLKSFFEKKDVPELYAYIESSPDPSTNNKFGDFIGLRNSEFKFIQSRNASEKSICLFDLKNDPSEKINIASKRPDIVQQMENLLTKHRKNDQHLESEYDEDEVSKIKDELKKMGYI